MALPNPHRTPTVLVVEDKQELRTVLRRTLGANGYQVLTAADGDEGLEAALTRAPDLVILDVGLPGRNGLEVARTLRERDFRAPVLMLTAHGTIDDRVLGFEAGADDYLPKPFHYDELLARVRALLRRSRSDANVVRYADLVCDPLARRITRGGEPLSLTQREYALLEYFIRHPGRPISREQISAEVWQTDLDPENNTIEVYVSYLRAKLEAGGRQPLLHTVRKVGYMLKQGKEE